MKRSVGVHDGTFHADEVVACALLYLTDRIDKSCIFRTRDLSRLEELEYVCDVGGLYDPKQKRFDHHQIDYAGQLSSAGMVLAYLAEEGDLTEGEYTFLNENLVRGVDAHDTGKTTGPGFANFSHIVSAFNPPEYDAPKESLERGFFEAFEFAVDFIGRLRKRYAYLLSCKAEVLRAMEVGEDYLHFDRPIAWLENFFEEGGEGHPAQFLIMPSGDHWKLRAVPPTLSQRMEMRRALPEKWAGLMDGDLEAVSGIEGAVFCHRGRFISIWKTKEAALEALEEALK